MILAPLQYEEKSKIESFKLLLQKGFTRVVCEHTVFEIESLLEDVKRLKKSAQIYILIDRIAVAKEDEDSNYRLSDSIQTAFYEGEGNCSIEMPSHVRKDFSDKFELDGIVFEEPSINLFSFNNSYGACKTCEGFGKVLGIDEDLVIPDKSLSVYENAIAPWRGEKMSDYLKPLLKNGIKFDFPIHRSFNELTKAEQQLIWDGNKYFTGLNEFFKELETKTYQIQYRVMLSRYRGRTTCPDCKGSRLRKDAGYVKIAGKSIIDIVLLSFEEALSFFKNLELETNDRKIADRIIKEITSRLEYLDKVGLSYLTLNRLTSTLSGGEFQRIKLATSLGSALVGSMYILDEPSIGLHPRDTMKLIEVLLHLRDLGNTVIVVEHEEEVMRAADQIIDIGPDSGSHGGELIFQGHIGVLDRNVNSHTYKYLTGQETIEIPKKRRGWLDHISIIGARENNLQNVNVKIPLHVMTMITGVSGSGKSTLIKKIFHPAITKLYGAFNDFTGKFDRLEGSLNKVTQVEFVDQNPIGKSSRSNPVTYVKAYDAIRQLYADLPLSKTRSYTPGHFSFNVDGGRCETCQGEGVVTIEMQFMADIHLKCEACHGNRFKKELLEAKFQDKDISEVLNMTIEDSLTFFKDKPKIAEKLRPLFDVGLGYIRLGQASNSLSGGEAQRVKLASFLGRGAIEAKDHVIFIFDEPTTGLHFHDIKKLLAAMNALVEQGNTVIVIEHNVEMIKCADWIIDLGPEGGGKGGTVTFEGTPEQMILIQDNYTAQFLREKMTSSFL